MAVDHTASVHIAAPPERVFEYFTRPDAMVRWMGRVARLDPQPGGEFSLDFKEARVRGRYLEVDPPQRLVITWGHEGSDLLPPGASTLEVTFSPQTDGTTVHIVHRDLPEPEMPRHSLGWRHFLPRLANAAAGRDPGPDPWLTDPPPETRPPVSRAEPGGH